jgi:hypothetical protein
LRQKLSVVSVVASLALVLAAAPAWGQVVEAKAGEDVGVSAPSTPTSGGGGPFLNTGNVQPIPDLVVEPIGVRFCARPFDAAIFPVIENVGFGDTPETTTEVEFDFFDGSETTREVRTRPLSPFVRVSVRVDLPNRAIEGQGHTVTVTADLHDEVAELNELNNFAFEVCPPRAPLGP